MTPEAMREAAAKLHDDAIVALYSEPINAATHGNENFRRARSERARVASWHEHMARRIRSLPNADN